MRRTAAVLIVLAFPAFGQELKPASDLSVHSERQPGIEVRYVDRHWRRELFAEMEKGGSKAPAAHRNWGILRLINQGSLTIGKSRLSASNHGVALWPNKDGKGMTFEMAYVPGARVIWHCLSGVQDPGPLPRSSG
jgi:hypothetical protein